MANHSDSDSSLRANNLLSLSIFSTECRNQHPTPTQTNPLSLFFTAPTQAMGPGNFTEHRTHTTITPMTTTSAMASEQNIGAMGSLRRALKQDEGMGEPMAGVEEQIPWPPTPQQPAPPPLRIDTAYQFGTGGRGPWMGVDPSAIVPQKDSRKSHVAKPDPFKD
jgi:hypothetical protein